MSNNNLKYEVVCPECNFIFKESKSISQELGILYSGFSICPHCQTSLNLTFNNETNTMTATIWEEWLNQFK